MKRSELARKFWKFMTQRNVLDWTIGIVIGTAFSKSISSFVNDIVLPPFGMLFGKVDFRDLYINLSRTHYKNSTITKTLEYSPFCRKHDISQSISP